MLKIIISLLLLIGYVLILPAIEEENSSDVPFFIVPISITNDTHYLLRDSNWQMMASIGETYQKTPFFMLGVLEDSILHLKLNLKVDFDKNVYASWMLDSSKKMYIVGEDSTFNVYVFMTRDPLLDIVSGDCWVWNSDRSDAMGYADDLHYIKKNDFTQKDTKDSVLVFQRNGLIFDQGIPSWRSRYLSSVSAPKVRRYYSQTPKGSIADVKVKSSYDDGFLLLDFSRKLDTGHGDDVVIELEKAILIQIVVEQCGKLKLYTPVLGFFTEEEFDNSEVNLEKAEAGK